MRRFWCWTGVRISIFFLTMLDYGWVAVITGEMWRGILTPNFPKRLNTPQMAMLGQLGLRDEEKDHISQVTLGGQNKLRTWTWTLNMSTKKLHMLFGWSHFQLWNRFSSFGVFMHDTSECGSKMDTKKKLLLQRLLFGLCMALFIGHLSRWQETKFDGGGRSKGPQARTQTRSTAARTKPLYMGHSATPVPKCSPNFLSCCFNLSVINMKFSVIFWWHVVHL